jgi:hypothetical protein
MVHRVVSSASRAKPIASVFEDRFPFRFESVFDYRLDNPIGDIRNAQRTCFFAWPRDLDP